MNAKQERAKMDAKQQSYLKDSFRLQRRQLHSYLCRQMELIRLTLKSTDTVEKKRKSSNYSTYSPYTVAEDEKTIFFTPNSIITSIKLALPVTLFPQYINGSLQDSPTAFRAAKCITQSIWCQKKKFLFQNMYKVGLCRLWQYRLSIF